VGRDQAIATLKQAYTDLRPGRKVAARPFRPADAPGIGRLFLQTYGTGYPVEDPYVPEVLIEANRTGRIRTIVVATEDGDIVGQSAFFRSSSPNPRMFEYGQMLVDKNYRNGFAALQMHQFALRNMFGRMDGVDALYGEAVCHHLSTQKLTIGTRFLPCGLEVGLMPGSAYRDENLRGRASCLMQVRVDAPGTGDLCIPDCWREQIETIRSVWRLDRRVSVFGPSANAPDRSVTDVSVTAFDFAGVTRMTVARIGADFTACLSRTTEAARDCGHVLVQVFLDLGEPWIGRAAQALIKEGFFFAGFLPMWFDAVGAGPDALLAQRFLRPAEIADILVLNDGAGTVRALVMTDMERAARERGAPMAQMMLAGHPL